MPRSPEKPHVAAEIIRLLGLEPHPEGGHFCQTFRDTQLIDGKRPASTAIYFLLARGERSQWHRVDAAEGWHWYAGDALTLTIVEHGKKSTVTLGSISPPANDPRRSCRLTPGKPRRASAIGPWSAVRSRLALNGRASS